jgi:hypothetical protein
MRHRERSEAIQCRRGIASPLARNDGATLTPAIRLNYRRLMQALCNLMAGSVPSLERAGPEACCMR